MKKVIAEAKDIVHQQWNDQQCDHLAFAYLDFSNSRYECFEVIEGQVKGEEKTYFDLASLTKPLTLAAYFHRHPDKLSSDDQLLLEHRAGLPAWAVLGQKTWSDYIESFSTKESETLYSDLSALRLMLEIEKKESQTFRELCSFYWDEELLFWQDLELSMDLPYNGWRNRERIVDQVNDDNCYRLNRFCSHAGLFATVHGLCRSLMNLHKETHFVGQLKRDHPHRFDLGWDTVISEDSLAGVGASKLTFGHLGFTGTSMWIDPELERGWVLLTNTTKDYWYEKKALNYMRRSLGKAVWELSRS